MPVFMGRRYRDLALGDVASDELTLTEAHLVQSAQLFGDYHPVHVNERFARGTRFGGRIFHGYFTNSLMAATVGMYFAGTGVAYLEQNCRFTAPVRPGDTLRIEWRVVHLDDKPHHDGGIVTLEGSASTQDGTVAAKASAKILVVNQP